MDESPEKLQEFENEVVNSEEKISKYEMIEGIKEELKESEKPNYIVVEEEIVPVVVNHETPEFHIVGKIETLYSISNLYYVTVDELMEYNNLKNYSLIVGQPLRLKPKESTEPIVKETPVEVEQEIIEEVIEEVVQEEIIEDTRVKHVVQPKETLYALSIKYKVTVEQIKSWNNLLNNNLTIGQVLVVSPL